MAREEDQDNGHAAS